MIDTINTVRDLLDIDAENLNAPLQWDVLLRPLWSYHAADHDLWMYRESRGWDPLRGVPGDASDRSQAWATACHISTTRGVIETERFRLRCVQRAIREHCGAWHAGAVESGRPAECQCGKCAPQRRSIALF